MAYLVIEDFKMGLDTRRLEQATPAGALMRLENGHINRGGEIEKALEFVLKYAVPEDTFGLAAENDELYVFGHSAGVVTPPGVNYQQLEHEAAEAMTEILNWDVFASSLFVTAEYADGSRRAFSDGTIVAGLLAGSGTVFDALVISPAALTYKNKMYLTSGPNLLFSASGDASDFDETSTGSGLIDLSVHVSAETNLNGLAAYQNKLAVLSTKNVAIWQTDPDPAQYELNQVLPNIGTVAPRSVRSFGDIDVFFLSTTGIRSLRAINSSLSAGVSDVGTPIDDIVIAKMDSLTPTELRRCVSEIEPRNGRFLQQVGDTVYVFTYFPASKISAWSTWVPGFNITDFAIANERLYCRAGNNIYLYGGDDNDTYTTREVVVEIPYLDARQLAGWKKWKGIDLICEGNWTVEINSEPNNPDYWVTIANITEHTIAKPRLGIEQYGPAIKLRFRHQGNGPARLSKIVVHYEQDRGYSG